MKQLIANVKDTWTWNHKTLLVALALGLALLIETEKIPLPTLAAETTYYTTPELDNSLEAQVARRANDLYEKNRAMDLEKYRHEAIREVNLQLQDMVEESPFVDYEVLKEQHGY